MQIHQKHYHTNPPKSLPHKSTKKFTTQIHQKHYHTNPPKTLPHKSTKKFTTQIHQKHYHIKTLPPKTSYLQENI